MMSYHSCCSIEAGEDTIKVISCGEYPWRLRQQDTNGSARALGMAGGVIACVQSEVMHWQVVLVRS
jgi:hypothetical protein